MSEKDAKKGKADKGQKAAPKGGAKDAKPAGEPKKPKQSKQASDAKQQAPEARDERPAAPPAASESTRVTLTGGYADVVLTRVRNNVAAQRYGCEPQSQIEENVEWMASANGDRFFEQREKRAPIALLSRLRAQLGRNESRIRTRRNQILSATEPI